MSDSTLWGSALPTTLWPDRDDVSPHSRRAEVIVYADFDGVLNHNKTALLPIEWCHEARQHLGQHHGLEPELVGRLSTLLEQTSARLVLSTNWASLYGMLGCEAVLRHFGFRGEVFGVTPRKMSNYSRVNEIRWDLGNRRPKRWVILNDARDQQTDVERSVLPVIREHLVLTNPDVGFSERDLGQAIEILRTSC